MTPWLTTIVSHNIPRDSHEAHRDILSWHEGCPDMPRVLWATPRQGVMVVQGPAPIRRSDVRYRDCRMSESTPIALHWCAGDRIRWSLIGCPTKSLGRGGGTRPDGRPRPTRKPVRTPLADDDERDAWLHRKLIYLSDIRSVGQQLAPSIARKPGLGPPRTLTRHLWSGTAIVVDPDGLRAALLGGIGPGKAYGCGLLMVSAA
ncbi:type I-E CRISPR-associated protein Cas6/Cse3/CasE [Mycobacterium ostraviense]|uniref:type I-E CRISPR-associated protein Cas6/Cse3/CasE n=1 Tax=Mycobacterium ostraviense TaxID=2738409 RepID=UPI00137B27AA|nr:type I-E CRISPR-associated protein Cas6/Cse3/CasE [Mycobacterium ostraviense]